MAIPCGLQNNMHEIPVEFVLHPPSPSPYIINTKAPCNGAKAPFYSSPSPLKHVTRLSLVSSGSSLSSNDLVVSIHKTPSNLTPQQRLKSRKLQFNDSLGKLNLSQHNLHTSLLLHDDEQIDSQTSIFNVPLSQPLHSINFREKFVFGNQGRKSSMTTASTRASSILSHESCNDTCLSISDLNNICCSNSFPNIDFDNLHISKDAQELTILFNQNEFNQIQEECRQRRKLLNDFKQINVSTSSISDPHTQLRSVSLPNLPEKPTRPTPTKRSYSNVPIPMSSPSETSSKYYTFTRPTWLPPKSQVDMSKHQRESENVIQQALLKESREHNKKVRILESIKRQRSKDIKKWQALLDTDSTSYNNKVAHPNTSKLVMEMYWRGIDQEIRSKIWWKQYLVKNKGSKFDEKFCDHYFDLYDALVFPNFKLLQNLQTENYRIKQALEQYTKNISTRKSKYTNYNRSIFEKLQQQEINSTKELEQFLKIKIADDTTILEDVNNVLNRITSDLLDTYPDMNYFQNYDSIQKLTRIIFSFVMFMYESMKMKETTSISDYYFPGLNNITAVFYFTYRNSYKTLVTMCQFVSTRLPSMLLSLKVMTKASAGAEPNDISTLSKSIIESSIDDFFVKKFQKCFKQNQNRLYVHFKVIGMKPIEYLPDLILCLFSNVLSCDVASHIIDIFVFENHKTDIYIKFILGLFKQISHKLFGSKQEIENILGENNQQILNENVHDAIKTDVYRYLNIGYEHEFIESVKSVKV